MLVHRHQEMYPRARLIVAGTIGLLASIVAITRLFLPTLALLPQFFLFPPLARVAIISKLLSPLLCFLLAVGWVWIIFLLGEQVLCWRQSEDTASLPDPPQYPILPQMQFSYRLERATPPERSGQEGTGKNSRRERVLAAPLLFQLDPVAPSQRAKLPVTPLPAIDPTWETGAGQDRDAEQMEEDGEYEETASQAEQIMPSPVLDNAQEQQGEQSPSARSEEPAGNFSLRGLGEPLETQKPVVLTLLKELRCWLRADDGTTVEVKLRGGENCIRLVQLAYIAWRRGEPVDRDKLLTYVLSRGKRQDMNTEQLGEVFDSAKRYLRQDLDRAAQELAKSGHPISEEIDFFRSEPGFYRLHSSCRVIDLETIEEHYRTLQRARKEGLLGEKLDGSLPDWVVQACQKLMAAYSGDFLQSLREKFSEEFGPWVKEPVTVYRDRYLDALLILANYESALGKNFFDATLSPAQNEEQRRYHSGRAAQLFYDYAMYAINTRWDQKVKFAYRAGKDGERVIRAARALRRCVVELGKLGNPDMIDQAYLAFKERMATLSDNHWTPDQATESDVAEAKRTTSAYRFSSQIPPQDLPR
jgi:hypothetical protein